MSNQQNDILSEREKELHEEAGLVFAGYDADDNPQYIGTDKQWRNYNLLSKQQYD